MESSLPPIRLDRAFPEPERILNLVQAHAPYLPVQRYFHSQAEYRALSGRGGGGRMIVAPNFRGNWAQPGERVEGARELLAHRPFVEAAARLFESSIVHPFAVYVNLTWQLPFDQGAGHTDVPAFRGIDRTRHPIWLLQVMGHSGLFEAERIRIATAVSWLYRGEDGGFTYWAEGPDRPPQVHEGRIFNTAIVGDNDRMFHRVRPVGSPEKGLLRGMSLDTRLERESDGSWSILEGEARLGSFPFEALRISLSWKANVYRHAEEEGRVLGHRDDLLLEEVVDRMRGELARRGIEVPLPADPLEDPDWVALLGRHFVVSPTVDEARAA